MTREPGDLPSTEPVRAGRPGTTGAGASGRLPSATAAQSAPSRSAAGTCEVRANGRMTGTSRSMSAPPAGVRPSSDAIRAPGALLRDALAARVRRRLRAGAGRMPRQLQARLQAALPARRLLDLCLRRPDADQRRDVVTAADFFATSTDGLMPWRGRPEALQARPVARIPPLDLAEGSRRMTAPLQGSLHHRHRLPRRRQDDADPPSAGQRRRPAARPHRQRIRRCRRRRRILQALRHRELPAKRISSSSPMAASAAPSPTISSRRSSSSWRAPKPPIISSIETSGLALPKPLVKAFDWPAIRSRVTVDGVIAVVDAAARRGRPLRRRSGRVAARSARATRRSTTTIRWRRSSRTSSLCADLIVLNKTDLIDEAEARARRRRRSSATVPRAVKIVRDLEGRSIPSVLLGLGAARRGRPRRAPLAS